MFQIKTFNAIAPEGMARFEKERYLINESENPDGIILRSQKLHEFEFPDSILAIARAGAGTNNIPVHKCTDKGIVVFNTPGANANAVKELVLTSLFLNVRPVIQSVKWLQAQEGYQIEEKVEENKKQFAGSELIGKKLGVVGLGAIGAMVANDAYRLGMEVVGYDPYVSVDTAWSISRRVRRAQELSELLSTCDFVTVHVPLLDTTKGMIGEKEIALMKPTARLLNFSREEIIDTDAVIRAIEQQKIAGFTTDFAQEKLLGYENIFVLPHLGASTQEAEINCAKMAARTLKRYLETGTIRHSVNFPTVEMTFRSPYRLTIIHKNIPNMLGLISSAIADFGINIENMVNRGREAYAYTLVDVAEQEESKLKEVAKKLEQVESITRVRVIKNQEVGFNG